MLTTDAMCSEQIRCSEPNEKTEGIMPAKFSVNVGDKVAYSVQFLKSIGMDHSDMARERGTVTEVTLLGTLQLARIEGFESREDGSFARVNVQNLAKVGANTRFCAC